MSQDDVHTHPHMHPHMHTHPYPHTHTHLSTHTQWICDHFNSMYRKKRKNDKQNNGNENIMSLCTYYLFKAEKLLHFMRHMFMYRFEC